METLKVIKSKTFHQLMSYAGVGAVGTIFHYSIFLGFIWFFNLKPIFSSCLGFSSGALVNYLLNYKITFGSLRRHRETMPKFFIVVFGGFWINYTVMSVMNGRLSYNYLTSQVFSTFMVLIVGFVFNKYWTFKESKVG